MFVSLWNWTGASVALLPWVPVKFLSDRTILNTNLEILRDLMIRRLIGWVSLIARFMEPTWGPSGADRTISFRTWIPGGGTRPENWWGCAAGRWKLDPKRSRKKLNLGPKRSILVKIGSFCTPKDSFAVGGWEKYPKKIVLDPAKVKKGGQNRGTYVSPIT